MPETAQEIFNNKSTQNYDAALRGVHGTYLFDIDKVGSWFVAVDDGAIHVEERKRDADCTISCDETDFVDIVAGRRHLLTSFMQGRVRIHGDMALAQKFHGLVSTKIEQKRPGRATGSKKSEVKHESQASQRARR